MICLFLHAAGNWHLAAGGIASGMKIRFQKEYFIRLLAPGPWQLAEFAAGIKI